MKGETITHLLTDCLDDFLDDFLGEEQDKTCWNRLHKLMEILVRNKGQETGREAPQPLPGLDFRPIASDNNQRSDGLKPGEG